MSNMFQDVKEFQIAAGQYVGTEPRFANKGDRILRIELLMEEVKEYLEGEEKGDLENVAKELADIIYIVCGTAASYGIALDRVFEEVHKSNMAKLGPDGKIKRREDGKILKPDGWKAPDINSILYGKVGQNV